MIIKVSKYFNMFIDNKGFCTYTGIMVSGTRSLPVILVVHTGEKSKKIGTMPPDQIKYYSEKFHVVFIGIAGTPFCDTLKAKEFNPIKKLEECQPSGDL